jgi:hypothetical protein
MNDVERSHPVFTSSRSHQVVTQQSALAPRDTTDAVARIIFAQIRRRTEMSGEGQAAPHLVAPPVCS